MKNDKDELFNNLILDKNKKNPIPERVNAHNKDKPIIWKRGSIGSKLEE
jgi:hypothetical protein